MISLSRGFAATNDLPKHLTSLRFRQFILTLAVIALPVCAQAEPAQTKPIPKSKPTQNDVSGHDAKSYCQNIVDIAKDQRYAWQLRSLMRIQKDVDDRIAKLEALREDVQKWIDTRDKVLHEVEAHLVSVYERMRPDAAAERLANLDKDVATALLTKVKPRVASAILNEMEAMRASELTQSMASLVDVETGDQTQ